MPAAGWFVGCGAGPELLGDVVIGMTGSVGDFCDPIYTTTERDSDYLGAQIWETPSAQS